SNNSSGRPNSTRRARGFSFLSSKCSSGGEAKHTMIRSTLKDISSNESQERSSTRQGGTTRRASYSFCETSFNHMKHLPWQVASQAWPTLESRRITYCTV